MKSATLLTAGALAVALNVAPGTVAVADVIHKSGSGSAAVGQGPNSVVSVGGDRGLRGERGPKGEGGFTGATDPSPDGGKDGGKGGGKDGGRTATRVVLGTPSTAVGIPSTATCATGELTGGGYVVAGAGASAVSVIQNQPIKNTPDMWQVTANVLPTGATITAYAVCSWS